MNHETQRPLVLVVDDYQDAREMYAEYLQFSGFDVAEATNGDEAIAAGARADAGHHPDGPVAAGDGRVGGDAPAQGGRADRRHPDRRADRARARRASPKARDRPAATRSSPSRACPTRWWRRSSACWRAAASIAEEGPPKRRAASDKMSAVAVSRCAGNGQDRRSRRSPREAAGARQKPPAARRRRAPRKADAGAGAGARQARTRADAAAGPASRRGRPPTGRRGRRAEGKYVYCIIESSEPLQLRSARHRRRSGGGPHRPLPGHRRRRLRRAASWCSTRRARTCSRTSASTRR